MKKRWLTSLVLSCFSAAILLCAAHDAGAEEFSLYGVRFGMTREEIGAHWLPLSEGKYAVPSAAVTQVVPRFDHDGKLYQVSFSVELPPEEPPQLVGIAFKDLVESKWGGGTPGVETSLVLSPQGTSVTVSHRGLRKAYIAHIREKIAPLLQP